MSKIVFSRTLDRADWNGTRLVMQDAADVLPCMKREPGGTLLLLGSSPLGRALTGPELIDEFRFMVNPLLLGRGRSVFAGIPAGKKLRVLRTRTFRSGSALLPLFL